MLVFKKIRWKNLLSTGNAFTEIDLDAAKTSLIVGQNGHGKSTILDALMFVLFGKPFRKINKPGLVNSVNGRDCLVEVEFEAYNKKYFIRRGIKPNVFEIYVDGTLLNQDAATRDYQEYLEKFILKMNFKSATQIVVLGSASFTPFMRLTPNDRRNIIESLLDIEIFSVMNILAKQKMQENREAIEKNRIELVSKEEKQTFIERNLASLRSNNAERIKQYRAVLVEQGKQKKRLEKEIKAWETELDGYKVETAKISNLKNKHGAVVGLVHKTEANRQHVVNDVEFYQENDNCPKCRQYIDPVFKEKIIEEAKEKIAVYDKGLSDMSSKLGEWLKELERIGVLFHKEHDLEKKIFVAKNQITNIESTIADTESSIAKLKNSDSLILSNENDLRTTKKEIEELCEKKDVLLEDRLLIETAISLLKDGGIKTKIIKQYIPIINKVVNKYLSQMGFFVNFTIDENFNESIKSRYRDDFSYENFSEGEKMRIDLALLFTWRHIARSKNSVSTNLLLLDEILDRSLDANGTDEFLKIIKSLTDDSNTFIISHKSDTILDKFDKVYRFEKLRGFSRLV